MQADHPRALALLVAQAVQTTAAQSINIIEVVSQTGTWEFPNGLPPFTAVAIVIGGRPGKIYTSSRRFVHQGDVLGEVSGPDIPFTTQITRANVTVPLQQITKEKVIQAPGAYGIQFLINSEVVAETPFPIIRLEKPPQAMQPS